jgi:4-hydroxyproline epimerase
LAADKKLQPQTIWRQESYIGSSFDAEFQWLDESRGVIAPSITSRAFVNADLQVLCHEQDPFAWGISPS